MIGKLSAPEPDVRQRRPDFIVHLQVSENTTSRLSAFRDIGSAMSGGGFLALSDEPQRTPSQTLELDSGLELNASIHHVGRHSVQGPSVTQKDYDAEGLTAIIFCPFSPVVHGLCVHKLRFYDN